MIIGKTSKALGVIEISTQRMMAMKTKVILAEICKKVSSCWHRGGNSLVLIQTVANT